MAEPDKARGGKRAVRTIILIALIGFVLTSIGYVVYSQLPRPVGGDRTESSSAATGLTTVVYYFHTSARCSSCLRIEAWTRECIQKEFAAELSTGRLVWRSVDLERDGNSHFVKDFALRAKTVVVANYRSGTAEEFADLIDVWRLLGDKPRFSLLVNTKVRQFLSKS